MSDHTADVGVPTPATFDPFVLVPLKLLDPNPWQPRESYDDGYLRGLAESIRQHRGVTPGTKGLLQLPAARQVGERYQIVFGHNRFEAFKILAAEDLFYATIPVSVASFDDEAMATMAWQENSKRKDLNAIEEAKAIARYAEEFGWNDTQIGARLGLDRSTVAHKRALLKLPESIQAMVAGGLLAASSAAALVRLDEYGLFDPPYTEAWPSYNPVKSFMDMVESGNLTREAIRDRVEGILTNTLRAIPEYWLDHPLGSERVRCETCAACPLNRGGKCGYGPCIVLKEAADMQRRRQEASEAAGLPVAGGLNFKWYGERGAQGFQHAQATACRNLGVDVYSGSGIPVPNVEGAIFLCAKTRCACMETAAEAARAAAAAAAVVTVHPKDGPPYTVPASALGSNPPLMAAAQNEHQAMDAARYQMQVEEALEKALQGNSWQAWAAVLFQLLPHFPSPEVIEDFSDLAQEVIGILAHAYDGEGVNWAEVAEQAGLTIEQPAPTSDDK